MAAPFPGMDPYLEHPNIWEDFHSNLATEIQSQLNPSLRPRYYAALIPRVTYDEVLIEEKPRLVKPDVSVFRVSDQPMSGVAATIASAPVTGRAAMELPVNLYTVEIREAESGMLVTAIEILSPVNKRPGHEAFLEYRQKRRALLRSGAHLMEIDLLRAGRRPPLETPWPDSPYVICLSRVERRPKVEIWPLPIQEPVPVLPVPLNAPDPDVPLDLGRAIQSIYDRAAYDIRIDYTQPPPKPDLTPEETAWLDAHLRAVGVR
ncbi:MAG TPA: DUF4058 family protein [Anaerolineales bacterium]|nr:DUF4058 family protein [Anaerolineales bacterium]